jgi:hypothetical protein
MGVMLGLVLAAAPTMRVDPASRCAPEAALRRELARAPVTVVEGDADFEVTLVAAGPGLRLELTRGEGDVVLERALPTTSCPEAVAAAAVIIERFMREVAVSVVLRPADRRGPRTARDSENGASEGRRGSRRRRRLVRQRTCAGRPGQRRLQHGRDQLECSIDHTTSTGKPGQRRLRHEADRAGLSVDSSCQPTRARRPGQQQLRHGADELDTSIERTRHSRASSDRTGRDRRRTDQFDASSDRTERHWRRTDQLDTSLGRNDPDRRRADQLDTSLERTGRDRRRAEPRPRNFRRFETRLTPRAARCHFRG